MDRFEVFKSDAFIVPISISRAKWLWADPKKPKVESKIAVETRLGQLEKFRLFQIRLELESELHSFSKLD